MPKEITHWLIASRVSEALKGSAIGDILSANPFCLKLGAVFPDALFYNRNGKETKRFLTLSDEFHGAGGEDTYRIVQDLHHAAKDAVEKGPIIALMTGIICHIQADSSFHPLVYYLSGNDDDPEPGAKAKAVGAHRRFESLMDLFFCGGASNLKKYSLKDYLLKAEMPSHELLGKALSKIASEKDWPDLNEVMDRAFNFFSFMQNLSHNQVLSRFLYTLDRFFPDKWREITALFYGPQLNKKISIMTEPITYKNPVTGQESTQRLEEIFQIAVEKTVTIIRGAERAVLSGELNLELGIGPSLSFGLEKVSKEDAKYFADKPVI